MASYVKRGDKWRVGVKVNGIRLSKSFTTKASARAWANKVEYEIEEGVIGKIPDKTFGDLLERYSREVSPTKRGHLREIKTIALIQKDNLANVSLRELSGKHFAEWRDRRLKSVSGSTVNREMNILSHACNTARKEWEWLKSSPTKDVSRPKENAPRSRRPTQDETDRLLLVMGYLRDEPPETTSARVGAAYLFAIETAVRAGELAAITATHVHERHIHLPVTKNGSPRDVPLSSEAKRILEQVMAVTTGMDTVFGVTAASIDALFRKYKDRAGVEGLRFHDTRREALTRLSKVFDVMALAKISGHKDLRILQNVYYNPSINDLADKLD